MDPTVSMRVLQLHGTPVKDVLWLPFYGGVTKLYLGLSLSPPISPAICALRRWVVRITQGSLLPDPVSDASSIALFQKGTAVSLPLPLPSSA